MGIDPLIAGGIAAGVGSAAGGLGGGAMNASAVRDSNEANIRFQRETNSRNEELMRAAWARDDNAVFRRAQDLQRAGLSKTLAAGSAAAASAPIRLDPAKVAPELGMGEGIAALGQGLGSIPQKMMQLKIGDAQADLMRAQQGKAIADEAKSWADAGFKDKSAKIAQQDIDFFDKWNIARGNNDNLTKIVKLLDKLGFTPDMLGVGGKKGFEGERRAKFNMATREMQEQMVKGGFAPKEWLK